MLLLFVGLVALILWQHFSIRPSVRVHPMAYGVAGGITATLAMGLFSVPLDQAAGYVFWFFSGASTAHLLTCKEGHHAAGRT